jgi:hypothetical protein
MASVLDTFEAHDSRLAPFDIKISKDANPNVIANELVNKGSILDTFEKPLGEAPIKSPVQDTTVVKPQVNVEAYDPLSMFGKLAPKAPLKPPKLFDGVVSISKSDNKPNFLERGLNALTDLFGLDNVGKLSEGAKAQALVMHMAKEEGIPLDQYRQSPELIEKAASSFISMSTLGLAPAIKKTLTGEVEYPATNTLGYIGEAVGSLAGLYGAPIQIAGRFVKPVLSFLPETVQSEAVSARVLKSALRDSVLLGPAIGLSNVGEALEQTTFTEAADKIWEGIKSGAMIGTIFGTAKGLFPKEGIETGARIFSGLIGLNAYRASQVGGNPFTKRPMGDVLFDIALDSLFLYKGLPKNMRFEVAKDLDNLNDKIDQAKKPPPPSGGGGGIPDKVIQQALSRVSDVEKAQIELEAKRIEDKAKIAIQAKADLEVKGKEIEDIKESYEVDDLIKDGRAKIVEPGTRIKSDLELAKEEGIKKIEEGPKDELVKSLNELGYDEQDIAGMEEGQRQLIISQGIRRNKVDIKQPKSDIKQETVQPEAKKEIERLNAEREYLNELQTTHNRLISGGATELEFRNEVTMRGSASNKPLHKGETWRSRNEAYIKLIEDRVRRLESVKTKSILRKKKVEKEPITDVDLQTGTPLPEKLSSNKHPFRNADKAQTNEMSKLYIEKIRNKDIDPEVFTQYLINEVNRYLNGDEPSTPIEKVRNGLSNAAANAENARLKFDRVADFERWRDTVSEAARWARSSDRLTNKRTGGTQLNMFIPVNELPEQVKGLLKSIKAIVRSKPDDLIKASRLGGPRDVIKRYLDGLDTEEEARAKGMTGQLAEDYGDWTRPSPTIYRNKEIFDATGFWLGKDGKWRYEIGPENLRSLKDTIDHVLKDPYNSSEGGLPAYIGGSGVLKNVPELNKVRVVIGGRMKGNEKGYYSPKTKTIHVGRQDIQSTFIHELQHAINDIVGSKFKGSNVEIENAKIQKQILDDLRRAAKTDHIRQYIDTIAADYDAGRTKDVGNRIYYVLQKSMDPKERASIQEILSKHITSKETPFENYMKDPGEMEARLASERMSMTPEQRKATPPWETLDKMLQSEEFTRLNTDMSDAEVKAVQNRMSGIGSTLYMGLDPTQFSEATKKIIEGAKALARYTAKARGVKEFKPGVALTRAREEFIHSGIDRSGNIRRDLLDQLGNEGYEIIQKMYLSKGASSLAAQQLKQMRNEVYTGLSKDDKRILDNLILADRMLDIGKYKTAAQFKFPEGLTPTEAASYNELFQFTEGITAEKASLLKQRSQAYFEWMKKPLKDMLDAELISQTEYDALSSHNYRRLKLVDIFDSRYQSKIGKKTRTVYDSGVEALSHGRDTDVFEPSSEVMALEVFNRAYGRILNNAANRTLLDLARTQKDNPFVAVKESPNDIIPSGWNRVFVYEKGERKAIYLSPEMAKEWITNNPDMSYKLSQFIRYASGSPVLRTFATGIDWGFALANLPRDIMHIWYAARVFEKGEWKPLYNSNMPIYAWQMGRDIEGVFNDAMLRKGTYTDYIKEGGGMEFLVHQGRLMQRGRHIEGNIDKIQDFLGYLGETSEIMTRLAIRDRVIKRRAAELDISYEEAYKNKKITQEATFAARDYMDFGQGGGITKALDNGIPYLNASVQGTRGLFRAFKDNPVQSTYKLAQFAALVTGLYIANQSLNPKTMESLKGNIDMQGNLIIPLGDGFGFLDEKGQQRYPYFKIPLDPGQKFFKTFFEASYDKATGQTVDVNAVTNSLSQTSPVAISSLPPTVSGTLGYLYNKDFWKNEEIWKKTDKPLGWPNSKEEYIPGQTPQGLIDVGSVTGMSPERLKYALSELVTGGSMWSWLVGQGYDAAFKDISPDKKEQHLAETLSKIPIIKRFFGVTNSYSQFAEPINEAREDSMLKRWIENRGLDQRVDSFLFEGGKRSDVIDYIKVTAKDQDTQDRLKERFIFSEKIKDLPNRSFWLSLKGIPDTEARAKVFVQRLDAASEVDRAAIMREVGIVQHAGGVISDKFKQDVMKFRDSRNKTTP